MLSFKQLFSSIMLVGFRLLHPFAANVPQKPGTLIALAKWVQNILSKGEILSKAGISDISS